MTMARWGMAMLAFVVGWNVYPAEEITPPANFYAYLRSQIDQAEADGAISSPTVGLGQLAALEKLAASLPADGPLLLYWIYVNYQWATEEDRPAWQELFATHPAFATLYTLHPYFLDPLRNKNLPRPMPLKPHHLGLWRDALTKLAAMAAISAAAQNDQHPFIALAELQKYFGDLSAILLRHWWFKGFREIFASLTFFAQNGLRIHPEKGTAMRGDFGQAILMPEAASSAQQIYGPLLADEKVFTLLVGKILRGWWAAEGINWDEELPTFFPAYYFYGSFTVGFDLQQKLSPSYLKPVKDPFLQAILDLVGKMAMGLAENGFAGSLPQIKILLASWAGVESSGQNFMRAPLLKLQTNYRQGLVVALNLPLAAYYQENGTLEAKLDLAKNAALKRITKSCRIWLQGPTLIAPL